MEHVDREKRKGEDRGTLWTACVLASVTLGLFIPLESYLTSVEDLWFSITELLPMALPATLAVLAVTLGIGLLTRGAVRNVYCALLFGGSLALYLQGMFLNADYGVLDGTQIDWGAFGSYPIWNTVTWAFVLLLPVAFVLLLRSRGMAILRFMATLLVLTQVFGTGLQLLSTDISDKGNSFYLSDQNEFHFSKNRNIVIFGFDRLSPTLVDELWRNYPGTFDEWDGFVTFTNSTGKFPGTEWSIANLFTGQPYNAAEDKQTYLSRAYSQSPYWDVLHANDYLVDVYTMEGISSECERLFDNYVPIELHPTSHMALFRRMYKLAAFRYAPHVLKSRFWMDDGAFEKLKKVEHDDVYYKDDAAYRIRLDEQGVTADLEQNMFHFYFLRGAHPGFVLNTPTTYLPPGNDVVSQHVQALNALDTVTQVLKDMKEQGIYDDALIILMGDHGDSLVDVRPAFVVKKPGATGALSEDDSFISQDDFWATIYALMDIDATDEKGMNVFEVGDMKRTFEFSYVPFSIDVQYQYRLTLLDDGYTHFEQQDTWYDKGGAHQVTPKEVSVQTLYPFEQQSQALAFCDYYNTSRLRLNRSGTAVWLCSPDITLRMKLTDTDLPKSVSLQLELAEVMGDSQRVVVARGETVYETITVTPQTQTLTVNVPAACYNDGEIVLELRFPDGESVFEQNGLQNATDPYYKQAIAVSSLRVVAAE